MAQLMPLPLTVSCFSKIQIGFTFLVPAHLGSPRKRTVKRVCVCVCLLLIVYWSVNRFTRVQRSTYTSCHVPSHGSVRGMSIPRESLSISWYTGVVDRSCGWSTSCITLTMVDHIVAEYTKSITRWSLWRKKLCG